ncbi:MAG TPA: class I SAM-dependent methyltransferase [Solirubrobacteraceae bacterium]|nr:class I SAM-dependent methyltransferase [Solirubrobacteraceae bacterium]
MDLHPATRGFEDADRYERARPDYPDAAVDWLVRELGLKSEGTVLDVGAGTGKLTRPLLARGLRVIAVEPVAGMRAALERTTPGADVRAGQAEALPLEDADVDGVVAGQAFHWFATNAVLHELARVLRAGGRLGLAWNRRDPEQPLQAELARLVEPYRAGTPAHATDAWRAVFAPGAPFTPVAEHRVPHAQCLDANGLVDRVLSISFIATLPAGEQRTIGARVRALAQGAPIELRYVAELSVYSRSGSRLSSSSPSSRSTRGSG